MRILVGDYLHMILGKELPEKWDSLLVIGLSVSRATLDTIMTCRSPIPAICYSEMTRE